MIYCKICGDNITEAEYEHYGPRCLTCVETPEDEAPPQTFRRQCDNCGQAFDALRHDADRYDCPACED